MCRVEFLKIGKRDVTFIREMRVCVRKEIFAITLLIEKSSFHKQTLDMYLEHFATCHRIKIYSRGAGTSKIFDGVNLYRGPGGA